MAAPIRIATLCTLAALLGLFGATRDAAAGSPIVELRATNFIGTGTISDPIDGNYFIFDQIFGNTTGFNLEVSSFEVVMFNPEQILKLGLTNQFYGDFNAGNEAEAAASAEQMFPDFIMTPIFHPSLNLAAVGWEFTGATVEGTNYAMMQQKERFALVSPIQLAPDENFTVTFRVHNDIFGATTPADLGELMFGVNFVPEPSTAVLLGFGLVGLVGTRRRIHRR